MLPPDLYLMTRERVDEAVIFVQRLVSELGDRDESIDTDRALNAAKAFLKELEALRVLP
jgi:hypothetical protein